MKKICVITGSRAEYGILYPLLKRIKEDKGLKLQIAAIGMHLSKRFGSTYREIEKDGFKIDRKIPMPLSDSRVGMAKAVGHGIAGCSKAFAALKPDLLVLLGDRFEIFAAATAAFLSKIPIAHIHGGEVTEGALDDSLRHAITKMSFFHFAATEEYRKRIIQLGEEPSRVFNTGALAVDNIKHTRLLEKDYLEKELNFKFGPKTILITLHPATLDEMPPRIQVQELLSALDSIEGIKVIFTMPNADTGNSDIKRLIKAYVRKKPDRAVNFVSLGRLKYLSVMQYVNAVVGNSSSGIIEAPFFGIPTVNIGDRQKGRVAARSIIHCLPSAHSIRRAINVALSKKFRGKKVFLAAPLHHHFEAKGWPAYKITMRFWVVGIVMAIIGVAIRLLG